MISSFILDPSAWYFPKIGFGDIINIPIWLYCYRSESIMLDQESVRLLKKHGITFEWNEKSKRWRLQKTTKDGKIGRTHSLPAESMEDAVVAVKELIRKVY
jgi:hypothetical protein